VPLRGEVGKQERDALLAVGAALTEELARQVRLDRVEQLVDPVVDLPEQPGLLTATHGVSMFLRRGAGQAEASRLTDVLREDCGRYRVGPEREG
jgi:hypothetical protein